MKLRLNNHHSVRKAGEPHLCAQSPNNYLVPAPCQALQSTLRKKYRVKLTGSPSPHPDCQEHPLKEGSCSHPKPSLARRKPRLILLNSESLFSSQANGINSDAHLLNCLNKYALHRQRCSEQWKAQRSWPSVNEALALFTGLVTESGWQQYCAPLTEGQSAV